MITRLIQMLLLSLVTVAASYSTVFAATAATAGHAPSLSQGIMQMLPMFAIFALLLYFMTIRPQRQKAEEKRKLNSALKVGDEVVSIGGIIGKIDVLTESHVILSHINDHKVTLQRSSVASVLPKGTLDTIK